MYVCGYLIYSNASSPSVCLACIPYMYMLLSSLLSCFPFLPTSCLFSIIII